MFDRIFGKKKPNPEPATAPHATKSEKPELDLAAQSLMRAIAEKKKTDPLIGVKIGSKELLTRLMRAMTDPKGIHIESVLTALGALAGFSCQMAIRAELAKAGRNTVAGILMHMDSSDGKRFYFGDALNKPLAESPYSVWSLAGGGAESAGAKTLPDLHDIFGHSITSIDKGTFGIPRVPEKHRSHDTPENYARGLWPVLMPTLDLFCDHPAQWPILYGLALQRIIIEAKDVIPPEMAIQIIMESAIPISKIDPNPSYTLNS